MYYLVYVLFGLCTIWFMYYLVYAHMFLCREKVDLEIKCAVAAMGHRRYLL